MNEPTMKEIAEWLREAADNFQFVHESASWKGHDFGCYAEIVRVRAAQVEAMGERRCITINTDDEIVALIELLFHSPFDVKFEQRITRIREEVLSMWKKRDSQCGSGRERRGDA